MCYPSKKCRRELCAFGMNNICSDKLDFVLQGGRHLSEKAKKSSFPLMSDTACPASFMVGNVAFL